MLLLIPPPPAATLFQIRREGEHLRVHPAQVVRAEGHPGQDPRTVPTPGELH